MQEKSKPKFVRVSATAEQLGEWNKRLDEIAEKAADQIIKQARIELGEPKKEQKCQIGEF